MKVKYVGPYANVTAGGVAFERDVPKDVPESLANALTKDNSKEGTVPTFEVVSETEE